MHNAGLIVGLGNPGLKYADTRHNIGFMVLDRLTSEAGKSPGETIRKKRENKDLALWEWDSWEDSHTRLLLKPFTYMNRSGLAVASILSQLPLKKQQVLVIHDEVDLPLGRLKLKFGGGLAGHKGLRSIAEHLGTRDFVRLRMGVGRPQTEISLAQYVLQKFSENETRYLGNFLDEAVEALRTICREPWDNAFQAVNTTAQT